MRLKFEEILIRATTIMTRTQGVNFCGHDERNVRYLLSPRFEDHAVL